MNILIVNLILSTSVDGVIERKNSNKDCMIYSFARGFVANGHRVTICASQEFMPLHKEKNDFKVVYFPSKLSNIFKPDLIPFPKGLRAYVKRHVDEYDLIIASEMFQLSTLCIADICKGKLVVWQELSLHNKMLFKIPSKLWYNCVVKMTALRKALVVPRSHDAKSFIMRYSRNVAGEIVEHGADVERFCPTDEYDKSFVVVAKLVKRKNVDKIVNVFSELVKRVEYKDFVLHIIGDGPEFDNISRLVSALSLEKNVIMHGFLSHDQFSVLSARAMGLLVNTSKDLNMVSIPEAIVNGTPVVMNTVPNTAPFVKEQRLGIVKDNWGVQELVEMIDNYEFYHDNCVKIRNKLTNVGCAKKMLDIFMDYKSRKI